jgi:L-Ala-D/L-Glu epimerase
LGVELDLHRLPLVSPWTSRRGVTRDRWSLVVRVRHGGVTGLGEAPLPLRLDEATAMSMARDAAARIPRLHVGEAFAVREGLDHAPGLPGWLRHGVLAAALDLSAREAGSSLAAWLVRALGSVDTPLQVHVGPGEALQVNGNLGPLPPEEGAARARSLVEQGFSTLKVKSLGDAKADALLLGAIRDELGDEVLLRLDANGAWSPKEVLGALRLLEPVSLQYVEEPLGEASDEERLMLARKSPVPVAWDESITGGRSARVLAPDAAALVVKPPRLGGVDRFLEVLAAAMQSETPMVVSTPLEGAIGRAVDLQLASLVPGGFAHGLGTGRVFASDLAEPSLLPENGSVRLPDGLGIGRFRLLEGTKMGVGH